MPRVYNQSSLSFGEQWGWVVAVLLLLLTQILVSSNARGLFSFFPAFRLELCSWCLGWWSVGWLVGWCAAGPIINMESEEGHAAAEEAAAATM